MATNGPVIEGGMLHTLGKNTHHEALITVWITAHCVCKGSPAHKHKARCWVFLTESVAEWEHFLIQNKGHWDCFYPAAPLFPTFYKACGALETFIHTITHHSLAFHILFNFISLSQSFFAFSLSRPLKHSPTLFVISKTLSLFQMRQLDQHSPLTRPQHPDKRGEKKLRGKIKKKRKRERERGDDSCSRSKKMPCEDVSSKSSAYY